MKKLFLILTSVFMLAACSVNTVKPFIVDGLKTIIKTKKDIAMEVLPDGDKQINLNGQDVTVPKEAFNAVKTYVNANADIDNALVDLIGSQITDENIALIAHYSNKYGVPVKDLLNQLIKK